MMQTSVLEIRQTISSPTPSTSNSQTYQFSGWCTAKLAADPFVYEIPERQEMPGILRGIVVSTANKPKNGDPQPKWSVYTDNLARVCVRILWHGVGSGVPDSQDSSCNPVWLSSLTPWAGVSAGFLGAPQIGQEVMIGFVNNDPNQPIILGCMHNSESITPWDPSVGTNNFVGMGFTNGQGSYGPNPGSFHGFQFSSNPLEDSPTFNIASYDGLNISANHVVISGNVIRELQGTRVNPVLHKSSVQQNGDAEMSPAYKGEDSNFAGSPESTAWNGSVYSYADTKITQTNANSNFIATNQNIVGTQFGATGVNVRVLGSSNVITGASTAITGVSATLTGDSVLKGGITKATWAKSISIMGMQHTKTLKGSFANHLATVYTAAQMSYSKFDTHITRRELYFADDINKIQECELELTKANFNTLTAAMSIFN
jgi:hypothetical protein